MKIQAKQASDQLTMKTALLKLMGEAELNQAQIQKLEAEVEEIKIGIVTEGERMRIQEINMQIGLQRERREGVMNAIKTMNLAFDKMVVGSQEDLGQFNVEMPELPQ
jgi:hypothetical protein